MFIENSDIEVYLITWENMEGAIFDALKKGYHGVSIKHNEATAEQVRLANKKGLKVQLWTPDTKEEFDSCLVKKPQFIQSDFLIY